MEKQANININKLVYDHNAERNKTYGKNDALNPNNLKLDTAFGINSYPICNQLQVIGEKYVVFMIGSIVVLRQVITKVEKFYSYNNILNNVTALIGVSKESKFKNRIKNNNGIDNFSQHFPVKIYLADSSENQDKNAVIIALKPYRNKLRIMNTGVKGNVKQLTFDRSKKLIACLLHSVQNFFVVVFNYRKQRLLTCTNLKISFIENLCVHPIHQKSFILMGKNYFRLWQLHSQQSLLKQQKQLVPLKTEKQSRFYDFSWQNHPKNPILFVLTSQNHILIIQNDILVHTIALNNSQQFFSIKATRKGFCVGGSNKALSIFQLDKSFNHNLILGSTPKPINQQDESQNKIIRIHSSTNDGYYTIATTNQIGAFNFYYLNTLRIDADISSIDQFFSSGFHNKKINSLTRSITKQILASCSEDNTVKIWNFFDMEGYDKKGLISHNFIQQPLSISLHPSGLFVAISFGSGFKIFGIVNDHLQMLKDIQIPNCKLIKYSNGGHYLVVNEKQHIFIYDSIYYQTLHLFSLLNHVQDICISNDDNLIITTCTNGYVYFFNLYDSIHNKQYHNKKGYEHKQNSAYNCIAYDNKISFTDKNQKNVEIDIFVGCNTQKYMVIYQNRCKDLIAQFPIVDCYITSLLICHLQGVLLAGTSKGTIRVYSWPLMQVSLKLQISSKNKIKIASPEYVEIIAHSYPLVAMCASYDENYIFTGSEDGSILCFKTTFKGGDIDKKQGYCLIKPEDRKRIAQSANDLYLERVDKIQEKNQVIKKLKFQIMRSEKKLKLQKEKLDIIYRQKIQNLKKQYKITLQTNKKIKQNYIQNSKIQYEELTQKLQKDKVKYAEQIINLKKVHKQKIDYEIKRNEMIKNEIELMHKKQAQDVQKLKKDHQNQMKKTKFDFYEKCHQLQIKYSNFLNQSKKNSQNFQNKLNRKEIQYEEEIQSEIRTKKQQISKVKAINKQLESRNDKLNQEYIKLKQQDEKQQQNFEKLFKEHNDIRFENLKSDEQILKMQHQLLQRLQVIQSKEETCKNARYQQTTLQNFRYMLDSKIQNLEDKKAQMIQKIKNRQTDLKNMFNELIKQSQQNQKKSFQLKQLNAQIKVLQKQIKLAEGDIQTNENKLKFFKTQVSIIANSEDDLKYVGKKLKQLVDECEEHSQKFNKDHGQIVQGTEKTQEVNEELNRQAKWMEKKLKMVKQISTNYKEMREENINGVLEQNTKLIDECNKLRTLNEQYQNNIKIYEKELADLVRKKQKGARLKKKQQFANLKGINKKLEENQIKISDQHNKLENISSQIKQVLKSKSEAKFPNVNKKK